MKHWTSCYQGGENRTARRASLLDEVSREVRELCPRHNPDWRFVYLDGGTAYYSLGVCPQSCCELAGLIELRLAEVFDQPVRLERMPVDVSVPPSSLEPELLPVCDL